MWPRLPASPRVATRKAIGEHPETRSSSLPSGCRVLSIASPVNTHLPVQARERTALNRQNATSLLITKGRALQGPSSSLILPSQELWEVTLQQDSFASLTIPALCSARVISVKRRHQQGLHVFIQSSSQGRCKRRLQQELIVFVRTCFSSALQARLTSHHSNPQLKGSARLRGFTLRGQYSSQGLCKASARDPSFCSKILVKGYAREGFNERSSSSFIQSDTVPENNRYALPTS